VLSLSKVNFSLNYIGGKPWERSFGKMTLMMEKCRSNVEHESASKEGQTNHFTRGACSPELFIHFMQASKVKD
jgi:hypothetical protein